MTTVRELEKQLNTLNELLDEALQTSSMEEKQYALDEFNDAKLIQNANNLSQYIDREAPTVALIKFVNDVLPGKVSDLQKKAQLVQVQLNSENEKARVFVADSESRTLSHSSASSRDEESKAEINLVDRLNAKLKPYMDKTANRTSEYSYGNLEWGLSFLGLSGYTKTQKLTALEKFTKRFSSDSAAALDETDIAILTSSTLGEAINPLREDEYLGPRVNELLTAGLNKTNQPS